MTRWKRQAVAVILCLCMLATPPALAQDARLTNIIVTNTRDHLLIYLSVTGAFREKMEKAIQSGVPATFVFHVHLLRTRNFWIDKQIADVTVTHTIKYNSLKKEYIVKRSWDETDLIVQDLTEARKLMSEVDSLNIIPLDRLEKGRQYQIRAKAELSKLTLPFYLHYVLFFISLWDFETDWYTIDFIY